MVEEKLTQITTLNEFIGWIEELNREGGKYSFRGLSKAKYKIEASAWRRLVIKEVEEFLEINKDLIKDARFQEHDYRNGWQLKDLEVLAELQHFRAATLLIDFTYSAQVALWFACQSNSASDGKVVAMLDSRDRIEEITPELLDKDIDYFFEVDASGRYPLYRWQPRKLNNRISHQYSVFLFGGDRTIEPDAQCLIVADSKQKILNSLEDFSQLNEAMLFPDFEGFVHQRSQSRLHYGIPKESGNRAYKKGEYDKAITYYSQAIDRSPNDIESYKLRGDAKIQLEQYDEALVDYEEIINIEPNNAAAYQARGTAKFYLGQNEEALDDFDKAIHLNPGDRHFYKSRADVNRALEFLDKASDDFQTALCLAQEAEDNRLEDRIKLALREIASLITEDGQWTPERFKQLVPDKLGEFYETQNRSLNLYQFGADLQNLIQKQNWTLTLRFGARYFVFYSGHTRVFGVNFYGAPRLAVWGTEAMRDEFPECEYDPTYYAAHKQWVYPRGATVEEIRHIFEFVYQEAKYSVLPLERDVIDAVRRYFNDPKFEKFSSVLEHRIGSSSYRADLVLHDEKGQLVVAVECRGNRYFGKMVEVQLKEYFRESGAQFGILAAGTEPLEWIFWKMDEKGVTEIDRSEFEAAVMESK